MSNLPPQDDRHESSQGDRATAPPDDRHFYRAVFVFSGLGGLAAAVLIVLSFLASDGRGSTTQIASAGQPLGALDIAVRIFFALYAIVPPIWFFWEFQHYKDRYADDELAKYIQTLDAARAILVGIGAALAVLYKLGG